MIAGPRLASSICGEPSNIGIGHGVINAGVGYAYFIPFSPRAPSHSARVGDAAGHRSDQDGSKCGFYSRYRQATRRSSDHVIGVGDHDSVCFYPSQAISDDWHHP
jgi:hypothetical protein